MTSMDIIEHGLQKAGRLKVSSYLRQPGIGRRFIFLGLHLNEPECIAESADVVSGRGRKMPG